MSSTNEEVPVTRTKKDEVVTTKEDIGVTNTKEEVATTTEEVGAVTTEEELAVKELLVLVLHSMDKIFLLKGSSDGKVKLCEMFYKRISCDEVFPNIFIGNIAAAKDKQYLKEKGITHVVNVAQGQKFGMVDSGQEYYDEIQIKYLGLEIEDNPSIDISAHFTIITDFIDDAVREGGKVLVHCLMGMSRSATSVLAYLMIKQGMSVKEATKQVCQHHFIRPNEGFLLQLVQLDGKLAQERGNKDESSPQQ